MGMKNQFIKENVIDLLGGNMAASRFWDIKVQAIYQWADGKPIPRRRQLECLLNRPDLFKRVA